MAEGAKVNSKLSLLIIICIALSTQVMASEINELVNLRGGASQKILMPVIIEGQQYYIGYAYNYSGNNIGRVVTLALGADMEKMEESSPQYPKVAAAAKALFAALSAKFESQVVATNTDGNDNNDEPLSLLDNNTDAVDNNDLNETGNGGNDNDVLPNGQPIMFGSQKRALAHTVTRNADGTVNVSITMEKPSSAMAWQTQRRTVMMMAQQLAICPSLFITNGSKQISGSVSTLNRTQSEDAQGNVVYNYTMRVNQ